MTNVNKEFVLKMADQSDEPCISIYISTEAARKGNFEKLEIKLKNKLSEAEKILIKDWNYKEKDAQKLFKEVRKLVDDISFWHHREMGLAFFISRTNFDYVRFNLDTKDQLKVSKYFYITPLINELYGNSQYYILALSKQSNRFYKANRNHIERLKKYEVDERYDDYVDIDEKNENIQYHSHKVSSSKTVFHGKGVVKNESDDDLFKYLKSIDNEIYKELKNSEVPLMLYCDEGLYHFYKTITNYNNLLDIFINGNPDESTDQEIYEKTKGVIENYIENRKNDIKIEFKELFGTSKTNVDIRKIIPNAYFGKIYSLLIDGNKTLEGYYDINENKVYKSKDGKVSYDLYNYAAILTLKNGGDVYVLNGSLPNDIDIEAINRY
jgi:hypothetical protein